MSTVEQLREQRPAWWWLRVTLVVLGAMIAWALRFTFGYLFTPLTCDVGAWLQALISGVFVLTAVAVVGINLGLLRRELDLAERFLLRLGLGLNVFFLGVMLLETTAIVFVDACEKGAIP